MVRFWVVVVAAVAVAVVSWSQRAECPTPEVTIRSYGSKDLDRFKARRGFSW